MAAITIVARFYRLLFRLLSPLLFFCIFLFLVSPFLWCGGAASSAAIVVSPVRLSSSPPSPNPTLYPIRWDGLSASARCVSGGGVMSLWEAVVEWERGWGWVVLKSLYLSHHWLVLFTRAAAVWPPCVRVSYLAFALWHPPLTPTAHTHID